MATESTVLIAYEMELNLDDIDRSKNLDENIEKATKAIYAKLLRRMADNLDYRDDIGFIDNKYTFSYSIDTDKFNQKCRLEFRRIE
jgi:hypothetical protein